MLSPPVVQADDHSVLLVRRVFSEACASELERSGFPKPARFLRVFGQAYNALTDRHLSVKARDDRLLDLELYLRGKLGANLFAMPPLGKHVHGLPVVLVEAWLILIESRRYDCLLTNEGSP